jgi:hypothetical protein
MGKVLTGAQLQSQRLLNKAVSFQRMQSITAQVMPGKKKFIDLSLPFGNQSLPDANVALSDARWKRWMDERTDGLRQAAKAASEKRIGSHAVDTEDFDEKEYLVECYEEYLRMADLGNRGRSKTTFVIEDGLTKGKRVDTMTFEEYLKDCLRNLQWRITKDLPNLLKREEKGLIGISKKEYDLSVKVCKMAREAISKFLERPKEERLISV